MKRLAVMCAFAMFLCAGVAGAQDICGPGKLAITVIPGKTTATVTWTNTGDDCNTNNATSYEIRRWTSAINDGNWQDADIAATGSADNQGTETCVPLTTGMTCQTTYYWAVFLIDDAGNRSPISNIEQKTQTNCFSGWDVQCP